MSEITLSDGASSPFDALRREDERGEYWFARDLMKPLGYQQWRQFGDAVERARISLRVNGQSPDDHAEFLREAAKTPGGGRPGDDYRLTREGAYAVVQNCDIRKEAVAAAHAYFRARTMEAEQGRVLPVELDPELRRIMDLTVQMQITRNEQRRMSQEIKQIAGGLDEVRNDFEDLKQVTTAKISAVAGEYDEFTTLGYAKIKGLPTDRISCQRHGQRATAEMKRRGGAPRKVQDATFGMINVYPLGILDATREG